MTRVLVTDGEQRSSLATVRSLGRAGHQVFVCSSHLRPLAGASRLSQGTFLVPDAQQEPEAFTAAVSELITRFELEVLIPMTDVSAPGLLELRRTHPGLIIPFPAASTYDAISDKAYLTEAAGRLGIPIPDQCVIVSPDEIRREPLEGLGFPLVLKPARSVVQTSQGMLKLDVRIAWCVDELDHLLGTFQANAYPILAQQWIQGPGLGMFLLMWEGQTVAHFAHRRIREKPPTGGVSVYRESVPARRDILAYAERLLRHFEWSGAAMVEFKEDAATGTPYLMEVNGRLWGSLQLAIDAGVDFPRLLVDLATGLPVDPVPTYRLGLRSRWLWGDVDHLLGVLRAAPAARRANSELLGSRVRTLGRFLVPWRPGDHFEVLTLSDLGPFVRETVNWFRAVQSRR